jgi:tRNA (guanine37-N1)-methyltransferase
MLNCYRYTSKYPLSIYICCNLNTKSNNKAHLDISIAIPNHHLTRYKVPTMRTHILTLFPEMFPGSLGHSILGDALDKGLWSLEAINIRDFATDKHRTVDDTPFGGGAGMVMKADIVEAALLAVPNRGRTIYLSPRGKPLTHTLTTQLAVEPSLTLLCGRYEGVDSRVLDAYDIEEISIGDYVLAGGEVAAMVLLEAVIRLIPQVLGNKDTLCEESFHHSLLEYNHYTRPAKWIDKSGKTWDTPAVLLSGHHAAITAWRQENAETLTKARRPGLWQLFDKERKK